MLFYLLWLLGNYKERKYVFGPTSPFLLSGGHSCRLSLSHPDFLLFSCLLQSESQANPPWIMTQAKRNYIIHPQNLYPCMNKISGYVRKVSWKFIYNNWIGFPSLSSVCKTEHCNVFA